MKTITLDDVAYSKLKAWKKGSKESFSQVVKRLIPEPGTMGAFIRFTEMYEASSLPTNHLLEEAVESRVSQKHDPWIS
jgi:hypothetical protein